MKNLLRLILALFLAALIVGTVSAIIIKDRPTAQSVGANVVVQWKTADETGVEGFQVLRREGYSGEFVPISGSINGSGNVLIVTPKGNNSTYEFNDGGVFKTSSRLFQYKVRILNGQYPAPETEMVSVSYLSSAAKRTWGSIKAMFR